MRILNVDDREDNRYLVDTLLNGHGFEVVSVSNGEEALASMKSSTFDLIISDILMPVMDGFQFCRKVKTDERWRDIPFIFYTATYTGPQDEDFAMKIGADRFLQKPCEPEVFLAVVRDVLAAPKRAEDSHSSIIPVQEEEVLKLYSERLVRKLEQKMLQLEKEVEARRKAEERSRKSEDHLRTLIQTIPDLIWLKDKDGMYLSCNPVFERLYGAKEEAIVGKTDYSFVDKELADFFIENDRKAMQAGRPVSNEEWVTFADDGRRVLLETIKTPMYDKEGNFIGVLGIGRNITERKRGEEERVGLQNQLIQAQKMESIGRLAGGVAHDFNNMLSVILGYSELALKQLDQKDTLYEDIGQIHNAAIRSTEITRQLLAFARKQNISPVALDLNETVEGMLKMLRRLIGEDIDLAWLPETSLWPVMMDPSQVDQILANLCVNARDAIEGVGKITIETHTQSLDGAYCDEHTGFVPGDYVVLAVSDDGCGMNFDTVAKIFEPFFTTKAVGQGTGLGLSTVYGIVKQNNGFINVYSEPKKGTTFRVYLARHTDPVYEAPEEIKIDIPAGHGEVILIVEDEASILKLAKRILENNGYTVMAVENPNQALDISKEHSAEIDLLITDVVMPDMNGKELSNQLRKIYPKAKTLFMSGYTANVIAHRGVLDKGVEFIQKPFSSKDLSLKVHKVLSQKDGRG